MRLIFISFISIIALFANSFDEGKKVFDEKCASCHREFIPLNDIKNNFFSQDNKILKLKAPTANMIVWAMMDSSKKIGDPNEEEFFQIEIESFLESYLENPDRFNSICDDEVIGYYDNKESMKGELNSDEYTALSYYFLEYKDNIKENEQERDSIFSKEKEKELLSKAKKENKKLMVYATSETCFFCKKMDKEVLETNEVKAIQDESYIFVEVDMDKNSLPFDLQKEYKKITPSFFVLDDEAKLEANYPGSWSKKDYIDILKKNKK